MIHAGSHGRENEERKMLIFVVDEGVVMVGKGKMLRSRCGMECGGGARVCKVERDERFNAKRKKVKVEGENISINFNHSHI